MSDSQQMWLFDLEEITPVKPVLVLPHYEEPKTDNERLLELQYQFKQTGNEKALVELFELSRLICAKFISVETKHNRHIRHMPMLERETKAHDAAMYMVMKTLRDKDWAVTRNYPGYLYKRVQHELYYQREVDKIVDFVDLDEFYKDNEGLNVETEGKDD